MKEPLSIDVRRDRAPMFSQKTENSMKPLVFCVENLVGTDEGFLNRLLFFKDHKGATMWSKSLREVLQENISLFTSLEREETLELAIPKKFLKDKPFRWKGSITVRRVR